MISLPYQPPRSSRPRSRSGLGVVLLSILLLGTSPRSEAGQDPSPEAPGRLITTGGVSIPTQGSWRLDGRRIIYTDAQGQLASIRASHVDLGRSLQPHQVPAPAPESAPESSRAVSRAPALVIDDGDVERWDSTATVDPAPGSAPGDGADSAGDSSAPRPQGTGGLEVVSWKALGDQIDRVVIHGTVRNPSRRSVRQIKVQVILRDERGEEIRSLPARLVKGRLAPGETSNFQARFGEFIPYSSVDFLIEGTT